MFIYLKLETAILWVGGIVEVIGQCFDRVCVQLPVGRSVPAAPPVWELQSVLQPMEDWSQIQSHWNVEIPLQVKR